MSMDDETEEEHAARMWRIRQDQIDYYERKKGKGRKLVPISSPKDEAYERMMRSRESLMRYASGFRKLDREDWDSREMIALLYGMSPTKALALRGEALRIPIRVEMEAPSWKRDDSPPKYEPVKYREIKMIDFGDIEQRVLQILASKELIIDELSELKPMPPVYTKTITEPEVDRKSPKFRHHHHLIEKEKRKFRK